MGSKRTRGRPSKLTPEARERLLQALSAGSHRETACWYAGIAYSTLMAWLQRGAHASRGEYRELLEAVRAAEAQLEVRVLAHWQQQIPENWAAARDFLARRFPKRWSERVQVNVEFELSDFLDKLERSLNADTYRQVLEAYASATREREALPDGLGPAGEGEDPPAR